MTRKEVRDLREWEEMTPSDQAILGCGPFSLRTTCLLVAGEFQTDFSTVAYTRQRHRSNV